MSYGGHWLLSTTRDDVVKHHKVWRDRVNGSSHSNGRTTTSPASGARIVAAGTNPVMEATDDDQNSPPTLSSRLLTTADKSSPLPPLNLALPLVRLLSHADPLLQEHGVTALLNLSICDENKATIVEAGAIRPLVHALKSAVSPAARENAACVLLRLSQLDGASTAAIGRAGAIPLLVSLVETGGARGKKDAATALYALCSGARENRQRAVETGAVRPLLDLMADPESGMVDKAAYVLHSLVSSSEGRAAAIEEGGIPVLVEMVEVGTSCQKEIATLSLLQIYEDNIVYRTMVAHEGAIPPLIALSQSSSARPKLKTKAESLIEMLRQPRSPSLRTRPAAV
ncbi:U-box domain-containing protein 4, partial [Zea mays]|uniref:U-box domain-containing protein 4 n=1 Tax=Zea mays TaxID=4577 RepID=UPI0004DEAB0F